MFENEVQPYFQKFLFNIGVVRSCVSRIIKYDRIREIELKFFSQLN